MAEKIFPMTGGEGKGGEGEGAGGEGEEGRKPTEAITSLFCSQIHRQVPELPFSVGHLGIISSFVTPFAFIIFQQRGKGFQLWDLLSLGILLLLLIVTGDPFYINISRST